MEQWEIDLRAKLEKEYEHGCYNFSSDKIVFMTGKEGAINVAVALEREARKIRRGVEDYIDPKVYGDHISGPATEQDFIDAMKELWKGDGENGK